MQLFDAHMHYSDTHGPAFDAVRERHGVGACTLACIPQMGVCSTVPDALYYKAVHPEGTVYVMGGLERSAWFLHEGDAAALGEDLVAQAGALLAAGCDGIKLLEGKPDIRRNFPIPDFDTPAWEPFWRWAEEQRVPILWHVNDRRSFGMPPASIPMRKARAGSTARKPSTMRSSTVRCLRCWHATRA